MEKENKLTGLVVKVMNKDIETALKILKRKMKDSGIMLEYQESLYFKKPSEEKKERRIRARLRERKRLKESR